MTTCEHVQAALLDESVARDESIEAHLAGCAQCAVVASAHRSALQLKGSVPLMTSRRSIPEARKRAGAVFGLLLAVAGGAGWYWLETQPKPSRVVEVPLRPQQLVEAEGPSPSIEQPQVIQDGSPDAEWLALMALQHSANRIVVAEYREEEVTRRVFGVLPKWVAPKKSSPMRALGSAASPVVFTQEDVP
ncbi:MAG: hypothetical protein JNM17_12560 [Archangium sp.]|nr:hypothetical protein [Archangium sp.]